MNLKVNWKNNSWQTFEKVYQIVRKESGLKDYIFIYSEDRIEPITIKINEIRYLETTFE